jgi:cytochrome c6
VYFGYTIHNNHHTPKGREEDVMKRAVIAAVVVLMSLWIASAALAKRSSEVKLGEAKFKQNCAVCHRDGGNIINPKKTLHRKDRRANNIKTAADIMHLMRNPGPGMTKFSKEAISDAEAKAIAKYVIKTFK